MECSGNAILMFANLSLDGAEFFLSSSWNPKALGEEPRHSTASAELPAKASSGASRVSKPAGTPAQPRVLMTAALADITWSRRTNQLNAADHPVSPG